MRTRVVIGLFLGLSGVVYLFRSRDRGRKQNLDHGIVRWRAHGRPTLVEAPPRTTTIVRSSSIDNNGSAYFNCFSCYGRGMPTLQFYSLWKYLCMPLQFPTRTTYALLKKATKQPKQSAHCWCEYQYAHQFAELCYHLKLHLCRRRNYSNSTATVHSSSRDGSRYTWTWTHLFTADCSTKQPRSDSLDLQCTTVVRSL